MLLLPSNREDQKIDWTKPYINISRRALHHVGIPLIREAQVVRDSAAGAWRCDGDRNAATKRAYTNHHNMTR